jgi:hypothetical protein
MKPMSKVAGALGACGEKANKNRWLPEKNLGAFLGAVRGSLGARLRESKRSEKEGLLGRVVVVVKKTIYIY